MDNKVKIIKSLIGDEAFKELQKGEVDSGLFKLSTKTAVSPTELKIALEIVPKAILSYLVHNLKPLENGSSTDLPIPWAPEYTLHVDKRTDDVYSGYIYGLGKKKAEFKFRSLPGVGLVILTTFELYDHSVGNSREQSSHSESAESTIMNRVSHFIDEKIRLNSMIQSVVDQRISQNEAIKSMILNQIKVPEPSYTLKDSYTKEEVVSDEEGIEASEEENELEEEESPLEEGEEINITDEHGENMEDVIENKKSKLKQFLEKREGKAKEPLKIEKTEIKCRNCDTTLFKGEKDQIDLCMCYGEFYSRKILIKKNTDGRYALKFPKSFSIENVEMLIENLKSNK